MPQSNSTLRFAGTLTSVQTKPPLTHRVTAWGQRGPDRLEGGSILLTVEIPRPELPTPPEKPQLLRNAPPAPPATPRPEAFVKPPQDAKETRAAYRSRVAGRRRQFEVLEQRWQEHDRLLERRAAVEVEYETNLRAYQERLEALGTRFESYARLAGIGAVLNGLEIDVTLRPRQTEINRHLPGFSPTIALLDAGDAGDGS